MASTDALPVPIKNTAYRVVFPIFDADGDLVTGATGLDSEVSKDQGTFADCTNEATEIATSSGMYYLDLTSTEMNADCVAVIVKTSTVGAKTTPMIFYPQESGDIKVDLQSIAAAAVSTSTAQLGVNVVNAAGTAWGSGAITAGSIAADAITAAKIADGAIDAATFAAGAINAAAIAADAITDAKVASDVTIASVTGAVGSVTGNVGGNVTGTVGGFTTGAKAEIQQEAEDAIVAHRLDELLNADSDIDGAAPPTVGSVFHELLTKTAGSFTYDQTTDSLEALRDRGDAAWADSGTPPSAASIADAVWDEALSGHLAAGSTGEALNAAGSAGDPWTTSLPGSYTGSQAGKMLSDILTDTAEIGAAGAGLTNINLPNQTMDIVGNITGNLSGSVGSVTGNVGGNVTGSVGSVATGGIAAASFAAGAIDAAAIAADAIGSSELAATAASEIATAVRTELTTELGRVDVAVSTRLATSGYTAPLDAAGTRTAVGLASANLDTQLTAIDDYLDTEVAAIKAKTDNLPSDPADASDIAASFATVNSTLSTISGYLDTEIAAIKAVTDQFTAAQSEPAAVPAANASPLAKIAWLAMVARNRITQTATTQLVKADDGTTTVGTATVSDDGTTFVRGEFS